MAKNSINLSVVLPFLSSVTDYQSTYANTSNPRVLGMQINMGYWVPSHGYTRTPIRPGSISTVRFESAFSFFFFSFSLAHSSYCLHCLNVNYIYSNACARALSVGPSTTPFPAFPADDVTPWPVHIYDAYNTERLARLLLLPYHAFHQPHQFLSVSWCRWTFDAAAAGTCSFLFSL